MLTRKAGPLPAWGWALLALAALFLYMRSTGPAASSGLPFTPASSGSAAQQPASGQGNAADNGNADLLSALGDNKLSYDALLNALQYGGGYGSGGGGGSVPPGYGGGGGGGSDTSSVTAATVDSGTNNAPVVVGSTPEYSDQSTAAQAAVDLGYGPGQTYLDPNTGLYAPIVSLPGVISSNYSTGAQNRAGIGVEGATNSTPVTSPTPVTVQPAPVDTTSPTVAPTLTSGKLIAV